MKNLLYIGIILMLAAAFGCGNGTATDSVVEEESSEISVKRQLVPTATNVPLIEESQESSEIAPGGVFRRNWSDPPTLDPHLTSDTTSAGIVVEVFSGLMRYDTNLNLVPDIAKDISIEDGVVYTFTLKDDVVFHSGKSVTAHDFKWSLERAANPETASPVADTYLNDIVGFDAYWDGNSNEITGIKVIDDNTLQISIDAPKVYFLAKMTYPTAYVLDQEVVEEGGRNWWVARPVGTGPFTLKEYRIGERIVLERFDDYYGDPAMIDKVEMNLGGGQSMAMYENDEIDITGVSLFDIEKLLDPSEPLNSDLVVVPPSFSISYIGFNTTPIWNGEPNPLSDSKFRQALNHAIDKDLIASDVYYDLIKPSPGVLPPGLPGHNENLEGLGYDPDLATRLLSESRFADPNIRPRITVTIPGTGGTIGLYLEVIRDMWKQIEVYVDIQQVEWATYLEDLDNNKLQAYAGLGWEADYPDPQDFLDILFHSESSLNHGAYSNPEVDDILESARVEQDPIERMQMYQEAEQLIVDDAAWVPLWLSGDQYVLIKPHVKGFKMTPMIVPKLKEVSLK